MLDFITKGISKLFGNKSERDIKELEPIVEQIHEAYKTISQLSNDGLRAKTAEFKNRIQESIREQIERKEKLKEQAESDTSLDVDKKEEFYKEVDEIEKEELKKIQETLDEILPEAFAVMKETAKRFKEKVRVPLILVGGIRSYPVAERLIAEGTADHIAMCRPLIREPGLVNRWKSGDVRKALCVSDNGCFKPAFQGRGITCVVEERKKS